MPTIRRTHTIHASPREIWDVISDPHHLPRWWPRVSRVEAVEPRAFTEVLTSEKGKIVRADFRFVDADPQRRLVWAQQVENTPFAKVLKSSETEVSMASVGGAQTTAVTLEMRQTLQGFMARLGAHLVRRATGSVLEEALEGLEQIVGH